MYLQKITPAHPALKAGLNLAILISLAGGVSALWAAEGELEPGLWEVMTRPEFPNTPFPPRVKTDQFCLTASAIAEGKIPLRTAPECKVTGGAHKDNQIDLNIKCAEIPQASGKLQPSGKTFTGRAELVAVPGQDGVGRVAFYYHYNGKWISECPPVEEKSDAGPPSSPQ